MRCQHCGFDDPEDFPFCSECGRPRASAPPPAFAPPPAYYPPEPPPPPAGQFGGYVPGGGFPPALTQPQPEPRGPAPYQPEAPAATGRPARLVGTEGPVDGEEFQLTQPELTIGRRSDCDIVVADPSASRVHARVRQVPGGYVVEDAGSANGTWVNGVRVTASQALVERDIIRVGKAAFLYHAPMLSEAARPGEMTMVSDIGAEPSVFGGGTEAFFLPSGGPTVESDLGVSPRADEYEEEPRERFGPLPAVQPSFEPSASPVEMVDQPRGRAGAGDAEALRNAREELAALERDLGPFLERLRALSDTISFLDQQLDAGPSGPDLLQRLEPGAQAELRALVSEFRANGGANAYAELQRLLEQFAARPGDPALARRLLEQAPRLQRLLQQHLRALSALTPLL